MTRRPTRRTVERAIDRLEARDPADLTRDREGHKVYAGVDLSRLPSTEAAQERAAEASTVPLATDRESAEAALTGARVIRWGRDTRGEDGDGDREHTHEYVRPRPRALPVAPPPRAGD